MEFRLVVFWFDYFDGCMGLVCLAGGAVACVWRGFWFGLVTGSGSVLDVWFP